MKLLVLRYDFASRLRLRLSSIQNKIPMTKNRNASGYDGPCMSRECAAGPVAPVGPDGMVSLSLLKV